MSRNYTVPHAAPKDLGGQKFIALMDVQTSQLDFALLKGIGASAFGSASQVAGHLAIGTHTQASKIESLHPVVAIGGVYTNYSVAQSSPVASGQAKIAHISNRGEVYSVPYPTTSSEITAGSTNNVKSASGVVYEFGVAWSDANLGDMVRLTDNLNGQRTIVLDTTSGNRWVRIPSGGIAISTSITITRTVTGGGGASVFLGFL